MLNEVRIGQPSEETMAALFGLSRRFEHPPEIVPVLL